MAGLLGVRGSGVYGLISHSQEGVSDLGMASMLNRLGYTHKYVCCHHSLNRKWEIHNQESYSQPSIMNLMCTVLCLSY